ncbi:MAG TPA: hypothetical protein VHG11_03745, partial [Pseudorhizobium sp.]|nr:hypothetical protein [Pseudorhizobium sp.]
MTDAIRFILNGEDVSLGGFGPTETLLDYLRLKRRLTGTKEGCAEGDCGAAFLGAGQPALQAQVVEEGLGRAEAAEADVLAVE